MGDPKHIVLIAANTQYAAFHLRALGESGCAARGSAKSFASGGRLHALALPGTASWVVEIQQTDGTTLRLAEHCAPLWPRPCSYRTMISRPIRDGIRLFVQPGIEDAGLFSGVPLGPREFGVRSLEFSEGEGITGEL